MAFGEFVCVCICAMNVYTYVCMYVYIHTHTHIYIYRSLGRVETLAVHSKCTRTEIPTIIDPVALGYFLVALGSIIVGISVAYLSQTKMTQKKYQESDIRMLLCCSFQQL
jgi:hypothetical protein